jgi:hypothetical protein
VPCRRDAEDQLRGGVVKRTLGRCSKPVASAFLLRESASATDLRTPSSWLKASAIDSPSRRSLPGAAALADYGVVLGDQKRHGGRARSCATAVEIQRASIEGPATRA